MKKILFIMIAAFSAVTVAAQTGSGWTKSLKKQNFRDSTYFAKGIKFPDGTVATTGFASGDTVTIDAALHFNSATDTLATKAQLRAIEPGGSTSVSRDSLYIGTDGYVHYVKEGYNLRLAIKDSTSTTPAASDLLTDLLAYWPLDETSGSAADSSGNGYTGTLSGTISQGTGGKLGTCYNFEADSSGYINFGNTLGSLFDLQDVSVSCWINIESQPSNRAVIGTWNGDNCWMVYTTASEVVAVVNYGSGNVQTVSNSALSTGVWHHIIYTADRDGYTHLYIDGAVQNDSDNISAGSAANLSTTNQLNVGTWGDGYTDACFDGKLDEIGIWTRVLTADEVSELYNSGSGLAYPF